MTDQFEYIDIADVTSNLPRTISIANKFRHITSLTRLKKGLSSNRIVVTRHVDDHIEANKQINTWLELRGYKIFYAGNGDWVAIKEHTENYVLAMMDFEMSNDTIGASMYGDSEEINIIKKYIDDSFDELGTEVFTAKDINDYNKITFDNMYLTRKSTNLAKQSFYPWLSVSIDQYLKAFMESDESVLVMFGPPGTGKSTFLRTLIVLGNHKTYLAYNKKVVESPNLISDFYKSDATILAYEDIDKYLGNREDGNQLMSTILNASDGVLSGNSKKKIVFSTNLPSIDRIDPALLRVGRCFDILEFRELTPSEAADIAEDMELPHKNWKSKSKWSLAEVLSKENAAQQTVNRFAKKVGFF